jgi:hypothetical protein
MIMMGEKRKAITAILGPEAEPEKPEGSEMSAIGKELIDAVHASDVETVVSCLKAAYHLMLSGDDSGEG